MASFLASLQAQLPGIQAAGNAAIQSSGAYVKDAKQIANDVAAAAAEQRTMMSIMGVSKENQTGMETSAAQMVSGMVGGADPAVQYAIDSAKLGQSAQANMMEAFKASKETGVENIPNNIVRWFTNTTEEDLMAKSQADYARMKASSDRLTTYNADMEAAQKAQAAQVHLDPKYVLESKRIAQAALTSQIDSQVMTSSESGLNAARHVADAGKTELEVRQQALHSGIMVQDAKLRTMEANASMETRAKQNELLDIQLVEARKNKEYNDNLLKTLQDAKGISSATAFAEMKSLSEGQVIALQKYTAGVRTPDVMVPVLGIMNSGVPANSATANPSLVNPANAAIVEAVRAKSASWKAEMLNPDNTPKMTSPTLLKGLSDKGIKPDAFAKMTPERRSSLVEEIGTTSIIQSSLSSSESHWLSMQNPMSLNTNPQIAPLIPTSLKGANSWETAFKLVAAGHATPQEFVGFVRKGLEIESVNTNRKDMGLKPVISMPLKLSIPNSVSGLVGDATLDIDGGNITQVKTAVLQFNRAQSRSFNNVPHIDPFKSQAPSTKE